MVVALVRKNREGNFLATLYKLCGNLFTVIYIGDNKPIGYALVQCQRTVDLGVLRFHITFPNINGLLVRLRAVTITSQDEGRILNCQRRSLFAHMLQLHSTLALIGCTNSFIGCAIHHIDISTIFKGDFACVNTYPLCAIYRDVGCIDVQLLYAEAVSSAVLNIYSRTVLDVPLSAVGEVPTRTGGNDSRVVHGKLAQGSYTRGCFKDQRREHVSKSYGSIIQNQFCTISDVDAVALFLIILGILRSGNV